MLTPKQAELLETIQHLTVNGVAPTVREMSAALDGKAISLVQRLLVRLEDRGYIRRLPRQARAIEILKHADGTLKYDVSKDCHDSYYVAIDELRKRAEEDEMEKPETWRCPRCTMTFNTTKPEGTHTKRPETCGEKDCSVRFCHASAFPNGPIKVWLAEEHN